MNAGGGLGRLPGGAAAPRRPRGAGRLARRLGPGGPPTPISSTPCLPTGRRSGAGDSDRNAGAATASPAPDRFSGAGVIELALLAQPGRARSTRVDHVMWVSVGARMPPVARRSSMNIVPIAAAATTRAMFRVATVTST